jgi:hypothetical protein
MSQRRTRHRVPHAWVWGLVLLALGESKALAQALSTEQMAEFLARARVVSSRGLPKGVTRPVTGDWKLWMVDFTRAFRRSRQLAAPATLNRCDRQLLDRVRGLTRERLLQVGQPYIGGAEADALLARRDLIVARFEELVASRGAAAVLFN